MGIKGVFFSATVKACLRHCPSSLLLHLRSNHTLPASQAHLLNSSVDTSGKSSSILASWEWVSYPYESCRIWMLCQSEPYAQNHYPYQYQNNKSRSMTLKWTRCPSQSQCQRQNRTLDHRLWEGAYTVGVFLMPIRGGI